MAEKIPFEIRNPKFVLEQIQQLYAADPVGALKEYTTNAIDGIQQRRLQAPYDNAHIGILVNKEEGSIVIQDNGIGMTYDFLKDVPRSIGESGRRGVKEMRGEKGFGMLAYCGFGDRANVLTRTTVDKGSYNYLHMERNSLTAETDKLPATTVEKQMGPGFVQGTRISIYGVSPKTIEDYFTPQKLKHAMAEMYDPILRSKEVTIEIGWSGKDKRLETVDPLSRKGKSVLEEMVSTQNKVIELKDGTRAIGEMEICLWLNPDGTNEKIGLYNKGVKVQDLTRLKEFDRFPWNSGKLCGYISENFCKLVPSRDGMRRDNKAFGELVSMLNVYEQQLGEYVKLAEEEGTKNRACSALEQIAEKLGTIYSRRPNPFTKGTREPSQKPRQPSKPGAVKRKPNCPFDFDISEFPANESNLRSKLEDEERILINSDHRDFTHFASSRGSKDKESLQYFAGVISKEAAWADYLAGRRAQSQEVGKSYTVNEDTMRAIQERSAEIQFELLEAFGILKKRKKAGNAEAAKIIESVA